MLFLYCNSITVAWIKLDKLFLIIRQCWGKTLRASVIALVLVLASSLFWFCMYYSCRWREIIRRDKSNRAESWVSLVLWSKKNRSHNWRTSWNKSMYICLNFSISLMLADLIATLWIISFQRFLHWFSSQTSWNG